MVVAGGVVGKGAWRYLEKWFHKLVCAMSKFIQYFDKTLVSGNFSPVPTDV